ncbi:uncharacterized protein LOC100879640 isoform X2 [Megachile rotundata]|uniref:uncharacterized protein LOC100879640 isoform X2 n=1 Tax=Megachile rotundata TaxID=143995 RepID=UPI000614C916|nr:PREDICTED: uncharacterized protein LOC100879640 [Megachile rotundata]
MKILPLVALCCCSAIVVLSESPEPNKEDLLSRASAQLERLAPYRRTFTDQGTTNEQWQMLDNASKDQANRILKEQRTAFEIYKLLPEDLQIDIAKKVGADRDTIELLGDPKYMEMMQERIKRSGSKRDATGPEGYDHGLPDGYHYGGYGHQDEGSDSGAILKGSGSLISGIANGIIGGLVSASSGASKGSSSFSGTSSSSSSSSSESDHKKPGYGHTYSYNHDTFGVWDIKKVIISTLMQAVKAISGGVIALKGQIIKGSGYLVTAKGKMITKTGDAITTLGRNIVKNVAHAPQPEHHHHGYYEGPPEDGHDESYDGPPPSLEEFAEQNHEYHANLGDGSDVDEHAGLLIMKPTDLDGHHILDENSQKAPPAEPEVSYHGPPPELPVKHLESGNEQNQLNHNEENHLVIESGHPVEHPPSSYEVPLHQRPLDVKDQAYPLYPPLTSGFPVSPLSIQQSVEYPPIHIQYALPHKGSFDLSTADTFGNDLSMYSSLSIDVDPSIKISTLKHANGYELPNLPHGIQPLLPNYPPLQGPLKIPLLQPSNPYWQNQGPLGNFDAYRWYRRRSSAQRRKSVNDVAQRVRLQRG